ncbi:MAG: hypothetical protein L6E13_05340 [Firmicutes bacterium]|nr:hypothetical protein [Bacillota bacterium]
MVYALFCDETNLNQNDQVKFFIYGGVFFPVEILPEMHQRVENIRRDAGYRPTDIFKFNVAERPQHISPETATEAKRRVLNLCADLNVRFIAYVVHHEIAAQQGQERTVSWAADHVIRRFHDFLERENSYGIVVTDKLPFKNNWQYLARKFQEGLKYHNGTVHRLDRITLFASTVIGASHASSVIDIVLGSFRYCVNAPPDSQPAREILPQVVRLMWCEEHPNGTRNARERGLILRPVKVRNPDHKRDYDMLLDKLRHLLISQSIR